VESAETIATLQRAMDTGIEDYNLLMDGNKSLLAEHDEFCYCSDHMETELVKIRSDAEKNITDLEARIRSAEAHSIDVAATGEKQLRDIEDELVRDLSKLHPLYVCNTQRIRGMCSLMPEGEPSAMDYLR
jgi:hypothetical protein